MMTYVLAAAALYFLYRLWPRESTTAAIAKPSRQVEQIYGCAGVFDRATGKDCVMLDIDGVLHPGFSGSFEFAPAFESLMRQWPHVDIVLSSDWRLGGDLDYLRSYFADDIAQRIVGGTYVEEGGSRHNEIVRTCSSHGITRWIALDDTADLFPPECDYLVLLDRHRGLSGSGYEAAAKAFVEAFGPPQRGERYIPSV